MLKNLVFDVGGVLIGFRSREMLADMGLTPEGTEEFEKLVYGDPLWGEFDLANISFEEVVGRYCAKYPWLETNIRYVMDHCEQMAVPRPAVWRELHRLHEAGYRLFLLSNYHRRFLARHLAGADFLDLLDGEVVSCDIHMVKPEPGIYHYLLDRFDLSAGECLFFDDRQENLAAAERQGMQTFYVTGEQPLLEKLRKLR